MSQHIYSFIPVSSWDGYYRNRYWLSQSRRPDGLLHFSQLSVELQESVKQQLVKLGDKWKMDFNPEFYGYNEKGEMMVESTSHQFATKWFQLGETPAPEPPPVPLVLAEEEEDEDGEAPTELPTELPT